MATTSLTKKDLLLALDNAYVRFTEQNRQAGSKDGDALMLLGRIVAGKAGIPPD